MEINRSIDNLIDDGRIHTTLHLFPSLPFALALMTSAGRRVFSVGVVGAVWSAYDVEKFMVGPSSKQISESSIT